MSSDKLVVYKSFSEALEQACKEELVVIGREDQVASYLSTSPCTVRSLNAYDDVLIGMYVRRHLPYKKFLLHA